jgi:hypothetical protein
MQTNCLESGPSGLRDRTAAPWVADSAKKPETGAKKNVKEAVVGCHVRRAGKGSASGSSTGQQQWNKVNNW